MINDVAEFRAAHRQAPCHPYEVLASADRWSSKARKEADTVMQGSWTRSGYPTLRLETPVAWDEICSGYRSLAFHLHSWAFLGQVLAGHSAEGSRPMLEFALDLAVDWVAQHPTYDPATEARFGWYDMAVGVRAYRLGYILDAAARADWVADDTVSALLASALVHTEVLADDELFPAHSNHGFYFAAGQAALGRRFPELEAMRAAEVQAGLRLISLIDAQFTDEGMHREHSPDYHRMVLESMNGLIAAGLLRGDDVVQRAQAIQEALAWFVLPDGSLAMFGDTSRRVVASNATLAMFQREASNEAASGSAAEAHPALRFALSNGKFGAPPPVTMRAFPRSGYVVMRDGWPAEHDDARHFSYLAQACAFHSRVHKHADDLSFVWYDRGTELLVDAGRYGYLGRTKTGSKLWKDGHWYSDPNRVFVESTRAHNTVEVDGRSHPRTGVEPYGSALEAWGEHGELRFSVAACAYRSVHHRRVLVLAPSRWLLVLDHLADEDKEEHDFAQWFQVSPHLDLVLEAPAAASFTGDFLEQPLHCLSLSKADPIPATRGQSDPEMLGWVSLEDRVMTPTYALGFRTRGAGTSLATLWAFGDGQPDPIDGSFVATPDSAGWDAEATWEQDGRRERVLISSDGDGDPQMHHEISLL